MSTNKNKIEVSYKTVVWQTAIFDCDILQENRILEMVEKEDFSFIGDESLGFVENMVEFCGEDLWEDSSGNICYDIKKNGVYINHKLR